MKGLKKVRRFFGHGFSAANRARIVASECWSIECIRQCDTRVTKTEGSAPKAEGGLLALESHGSVNDENGILGWRPPTISGSVDRGTAGLACSGGFRYREEEPDILLLGIRLDGLEHLYFCSALESATRRRFFEEKGETLLLAAPGFDRMLIF